MFVPDRFAFGDFVLERSQQRVLRADGTALVLTPRLFDALALFLLHPGKLLDKDTLMKALWPGLVVEENNLSQVVAGLRRALGDDRHDSRFIQTVPRRGFRFIAEVTPLPDGPPFVLQDSVGAATSAAVGQDVAAVVVDAFGAGGRRSWLRVALITSVGIGVGGTGWWVWRRGRPMAAALPANTLAVLPFKPLATEGRDSLLEVGMADSLATRLSTVPGLVVRSAGSVMRYAGPTQDPLRAARELDVDWIVDGSLQRSGASLRVTARLLRAADGTAAWSGSFDESVVGVFELQDQISTKVMYALLPLLNVGAPVRSPLTELGGTRNPEAYQLYLAAAWRAQGSQGDSAGKAVALLQQALAIDPDYALAWTLLAWTHRRKLWRNDGVPSEVFASAQEALQHAMHLTPELAQVHAGLGFRHTWFDFDWPRGERAFRQALRANPNEVSAHWGLTQLLMMQGRLEEGFEHMRQARELDPMSPVFNALEACYLVRAGKLDAARKRLDRAFDIAPEHGLAFEALALLRSAEQQSEQAVAALRRAVERSDGSSRQKAKLAAMLAAQGQRVEANALLVQLLDASRAHYVPPSTPALVQAALGQTEAALDGLEQAMAVHDTWLMYLKDDPGWNALRQEPRFVALLRKLEMDRFGPGLMPI